MIYYKKNIYYWGFTNIKYCNCDIESSICNHKKRLEDVDYRNLCIYAIEKLIINKNNNIKNK